MRPVLMIVLLGLAVGFCTPAVFAVDAPDSGEPAVADAPTTPAGDAAGGSSAAMTTLIASLTIFVLAVFVGFEVITKVPPTLHTPLMSGSNAISGITVVGALLAAAAVEDGKMVALLGMFAVALATVNVVGGFLVTHRMLAMFKKK